MHVDPSLRDFLVQARLREIVEASQPPRVHPEEIDRNVTAELGQQVGPGDAPTTRRFIDHRHRPRQLPRIPVARVDHAVFDDAGAGAAGIPEEIVEMRDVDDGQVGAVGRWMAHLRDHAFGRVVLEVDSGYVASGTPAAQPLRGEGLELPRALHDDDVDLLAGRLLGRDFAHGRRPVPGLGSTTPVGTSVRQDGDQVFVRTLHEGGGPGAVHVPDQDLHEAITARKPASWSIAATTSSTVTSLRQGCPGTGQARARVPAQAAC